MSVYLVLLAEYLAKKSPGFGTPTQITIRTKIITYSILKTINPVRFCASDGQIIPGSDFAGNGKLCFTDLIPNSG